MTVRVRIAPSPTGDPHVGTGYIALFNYAFAKQKGGKFILRIEDTDQKRSTPESEQAILDAIDWLGINWDEGPNKGGPKGPYRQSERTEIYREHAQILLESGGAYKCVCTSERLEALRKEQMANKASFLGYDGRCRERPASEIEEEISKGASFVVRLKTPASGTSNFSDTLRGDIAINWEEIDDQVLVKSDGFPTYHLANVVDDHLMEITHVIRGEEWISSTPKHVHLYKSFGWQAPEFVHLPLLRNQDKSKVSKRKNPVSISYYKQAGFLPEVFINFLGMMAFTFADGREVFTLSDFVENFDLKRISLGGPVFEQQKLLWLNGRYLREKRSASEYKNYIIEQLFNDEYLSKVTELVQPRVEKSEDFIDYAGFFFAATVPTEVEKLVIKDLSKKKSTKRYEELVERVDGLYDFSPENIKILLNSFCEQKDLRARDVFMNVRLMVTGRKSSPDLFETMSVLGRERCRQRMRHAIARFKKYDPQKVAS